MNVAFYIIILDAANMCYDYAKWVPLLRNNFFWGRWRHYDPQNLDWVIRIGIPFLAGFS